MDGPLFLGEIRMEDDEIALRNLVRTLLQKIADNVEKRTGKRPEIDADSIAVDAYLRMEHGVIKSAGQLQAYVSRKIIGNVIYK